MTRFLALAGLILLAGFAALAALPVHAQTTLAVAGLSVDLAPFFNDLFALLAAAAAGMVVWVAQRVAALLHLKISAQTGSLLESAAFNSATYGLGKVQALIAAKGWDHAEVKSQAVALAIPYFTSRFPGALKAAGVNLNDPVALSATVEGLLERVFPDAVSAAASSPATPDAALTAAKAATPATVDLTVGPVNDAAAPAASPLATAAAVALFLVCGMGLSACGSTALIKPAIATAEAIDPSISPDVAKACAVAVATTDIAVAAGVAKGGAANTVTQANTLAHASCDTPAAQATLTANDAAPSQPDGGSAAWLTGLATAAKIAVMVAPLL
jgi:hypothetical protein